MQDHQTLVLVPTEADATLARSAPQQPTPSQGRPLPGAYLWTYPMTTSIKVALIISGAAISAMPPYIEFSPRIMKAAASPVSTPWMWKLAYGQHEGRTPTPGYEPTREAASRSVFGNGAF